MIIIKKLKTYHRSFFVENNCEPVLCVCGPSPATRSVNRFRLLTVLFCWNVGCSRLTGCWLKSPVTQSPND